MGRSAHLMVLCLLFVATLQVDNEYCSLNLSKDDCLQKTTMGSCCWLTFTHKNGYGRDIDGCFDYRFIVNSLKFVTNPKGFDTMSDSDVCSKLQYQCTSVTKDNFLKFFNSATAVPDVSLITNIAFSECHA